MTLAERNAIRQAEWDRYLHAYPPPTPDQLAALGVLRRVAESLGCRPDDVTAKVAKLHTRLEEVNRQMEELT